MIEGLQLKIEHTELKRLLESRAEHHRTRAATKEAELPNLRKSYESIKAATPETVEQVSKAGNSYHVQQNPVDAMEKDIKAHKEKALVFEFFANHLFPETYSLDETALIRLELLRY